MDDRDTGTVRVEVDGAQNGAATSPQQQDGAADAPEAQPPVTDVPPQDTTPDLGGQALPTPSPEQIVQASGGSIADRMKARFEGIAATEEFPVPGWELPDGKPGLIVVARAFGDRKAFNSGVSNEAFIAKSTHKLLFVNDNGEREEVQGGWGPALAGIIGVKVMKAADLVALVISKPNPNNPEERIPNVAGIGTLATQLVEWAGKGSREAEDDLGE